MKKYLRGGYRSMSKTEHPYCEEGRVLREHGEDIAGLEARVNDQKSMTSKLFAHTDELRVTAAKNATMIEGIQKTLDNGITDHLEKKIDSLCAAVHAQSTEMKNTEKEVRLSHEVLADQVKVDHGEMVVRVSKLEEISWLPKLIDKGSKRAIAIIIGLIIGASAVVNTSMWAIFKSEFFGEKPKLMQSVANTSFQLKQTEAGFVLVPINGKEVKQAGTTKEGTELK
jgi:hypothetical protein